MLSIQEFDLFRCTPLLVSLKPSPIFPCVVCVKILRLCLGVYKGMEWNDHKGMKRNGMKCI